MLRGALDPTTVEPTPADLDALPNATVVTFPGTGVHPLGAGEATCSFAIRAAFVDDPGRAPDTGCLTTPRATLS
jgi:hypothetical protein